MGNGLQSLQFAGRSASIPDPNAPIEETSGLIQTPPFTLLLPTQRATHTFFVHRVTLGQATTQAFTVLDKCAPWPTVVGGGPSAF